jgi:hypothetical protein
VGGIPTPLKNIFSSDWIIIPSIGENKSHVPNHQPVDDFILCFQVQWIAFQVTFFHSGTSAFQSNVRKKIV